MINWLLQSTPDGATYLQAITLSLLTIGFVIGIVREITDIFVDK